MLIEPDGDRDNAEPDHLPIGASWMDGMHQVPIPIPAWARRRTVRSRIVEMCAAIGLAVTVLPVTPAVSKGPSTEAEWDRLYSACVDGLNMSRSSQTPNVSVPAICACVRDNLRRTQEDDRDSAFPQIRSHCVQSATNAVAGSYPSDAIRRIRADCERRKDVASNFLVPHCDCYTKALQSSVTWKDFRLLDSAISTKGMWNLDADEKKILGRVLEADYYCTQKVK